MLAPFKENLEERASKSVWKRVFGFVFVIVLLFGGLAAYNLAFAKKIYPGISIGYEHLGGMTYEDAYRVLSERIESSLVLGLRVKVGEDARIISLDSIGSEDPDLSRRVVDTDIDAALDEAFARGREGSTFGNLFLPVTVLIEQPRYTIPTRIDTEEVQERVNEEFPEYKEVPKPTRFEAEEIYGVWSVQALEGDVREVLALNDVLDTFATALSEVDPVLLNHVWDLPVVTIEPILSAEDAEKLTPDVLDILKRLPVGLTREDDERVRIVTTLTDADVASMLLPTSTGVDLDVDRMRAYLETVALEINEEPQNARLLMHSEDPSRVAEFVPSVPGVELNLDESVERITSYVLNPEQEEDTISLKYAVRWPDVQVADTNDLGIKEILGFGTSDFSGSPRNRIGNIRNGVEKLNGMLIAPGETISLVESLKPFTFENGYLPELVIKGDKIEPELGGGLCQIGTTTFRATMQAGLEITERRNHSLVVGYYNDPSNGNPGTDATLYDSSPDYKFTNDTENYIMLQAEMDVYKGELRFTFWGTPDGREASYSAPVVHEWFPAGETKYIETEDLEPGVEECQGAHPGAFTSFTYFVTYENGETHEEEYTSRYRSLPEICLIGIDPDATEEEIAPVLGEVEYDPFSPFGATPQ